MVNMIPNALKAKQIRESERLQALAMTYTPGSRTLIGLDLILTTVHSAPDYSAEVCLSVAMLNACLWKRDQPQDIGLLPHAEVLLD